MYLPILPELAVEKWHSPPIYVEQFWVPVRHQKKITAMGVNNNKNWKNPDQEKKNCVTVTLKGFDILSGYPDILWFIMLNQYIISQWLKIL